MKHFTTRTTAKASASGRRGGRTAGGQRCKPTVPSLGSSGKLERLQISSHYAGDRRLNTGRELPWACHYIMHHRVMGNRAEPPRGRRHAPIHKQGVLPSVRLTGAVRAGPQRPSYHGNPLRYRPDPKAPTLCFVESCLPPSSYSRRGYATLTRFSTTVSALYATHRFHPTKRY